MRGSLGGPREGGFVKCIDCGADAGAICQFCGRAVCGNQIKTGLFVTGYTGKAAFWNVDDDAVRVEDAVHCGVYHPEYRTTG